MELVFRPENERVVAWGDRKILVAAKSMALFELDPVGEAILTYARVCPRFTLERLLAYLKGAFSPREIAEAVDELVSLEVLAPAWISKEERKPLLVPVERFPLSSLVFQVSNKCNMHCSYCYEPEEAKYGPLAQHMDWETAKRSVDFLLERSQGSPEVHLVFFGGEPLLNFKLMKQVVAYAQKRAAQEAKKVDFSLTTNGTLLTDEVIDFLGQYRFGITVSMDGPKDIQDKRRFLSAGRGSYEVVVSRVQKLLQRYTARPVVARVTLTRGTVEVVRIYRHLTELGFFEVGFSPVTARRGEAWGLEASDLDRLLLEFQELGALYVERALNNQYTGFANLSTLLADLHQGTTKALPCGAGLGLLDVDGRGDVYLCHRFSGSEDYCYGNVREGVDYERLSAFIQKARVDEKPVCQTCWIRGICAGGCYHEAYTTFGNGLLPNLHYCNWLRAWTEYGVRVYMEIQEKNPGFIERYVLRGRQEAPRELL